MSEPAVQVENLGKRYQMGVAPPLGYRLNAAIQRLSPRAQARRALSHVFPARWPPRPRVAAPTRTEFWALRDVSFAVEPGEVLGIIGRNGAGKSTLLKILSRITCPTEGQAVVRGRIGSLLEIGTGFHPELSGRENIFINGVTLGLNHAEIKHHFDEIVAFAEIEKFIDTPVKHYSSGMYMRLAFAVAAHLLAEIMIIDEVLAVGDASFQKKCLAKMENVAHQGRTVLFVSHGMASVVSLCTRCILLEDGKLVMDGKPVDVTNAYMDQVSSTIDTRVDLANVKRYGSGKAKFESVDMVPMGPGGKEEPVLRTGHDLAVYVVLRATAPVLEGNVAIIIYDAAGYRVIDANTALQDCFVNLAAGQEAHVRIVLRNVLLRPGSYNLGLWLGRQGMEDIDGITTARTFNVEIDPERTRHGTIFPGVYQCRFDLDVDVAPLPGLQPTAKVTP
jgi:lipopolysaccharide transport system ATP-binding protein